MTTKVEKPAKYIKPYSRPKNLNQKQFDFLEYFLESGNQVQSAIKAGYSKKSAAISASQILKSGKGKEYIRKRTAEMDAGKIAKANEVMEYLTAVMRGEITEANGHAPSLQERTRAATELAKRLIDRGKDTMTQEIKIFNDIPKISAKQVLEKNKLEDK